MLRRLLEEREQTPNQYVDENRVYSDNFVSPSAVDHTKSMGVGDESHDSLLFDEESAKLLRDRTDGFHKRPLSQNNILRSKSSRQKRRKKASELGPSKLHNKQEFKHKHKVAQEISDSEQLKSVKLIDDSKFGNK